jgi:non-canonical purine NTP pyrophosphatase (RdgB/HAM1 family)
MQNITFVTGNANKLRELEAIAKDRLNFNSQRIDLVEIQSSDLKEIVEHKLKEAYQKIGEAVIVEDTAAGLDSLNGLPGPFIKFFHDKIGDDALYQLAKKEGELATIVCTAGYFDGKNLLIAEGTIKGRVVKPRGDNGFQLDKVFVPEGESRTMAEMSLEEKNKISHRSKAFSSLIEQIIANT